MNVLVTLRDLRALRGQFSLSSEEGKAVNVERRTRLNWPAALLVPDPTLGWQGAEQFLLGIPALVRLLLALHRGGVQEVFFPAGAESLIPLLQTHGGRKSLPQCIWLKVEESAVSSRLVFACHPLGPASQPPGFELAS